MSKKIGVIIKEPGKYPRHVNISTSNENLKNTVGGEISEFLICSDLVIMFNTKQEGLARCCEIGGMTFFGTIIFCGIGHPDEEAADELTDIPTDFKTFKQLFPELWN